MDFIDEVRARSARFQKRLEHPIETEEATKTSFVLPFIQMLGYDIFDPVQVIPEFTADVGTKRGEKVDYALMRDGKPAVLVECKVLNSELDSKQVGQLLRYYTVTEATVGILTDGINYRFFGDTDENKVMDDTSFFDFNMLEFTEGQVRELKRFHRAEFDAEQIADVARELKYASLIKQLLANEFAEPSEAFLRFIVREVSDGNRRITSRVLATFRTLTQRAFAQFINDRIDARFKAAQDIGRDTADESEEEPDFVQRELDSLSIIKAIVAGTCNVRRVGLRSTKTYASVVLLREEGLNPATFGEIICRLWVRNEKSMSLGIPGRQYEQLADLENLYDHTAALRQAVENLESRGGASQES